MLRAARVQFWLKCDQTGIFLKCLADKFSPTKVTEISGIIQRINFRYLFYSTIWSHWLALAKKTESCI